MFQCKDCKYLDFTQKHSVGYVCLNTNRRVVLSWSRSYGRCKTLYYLKHPTDKACVTGFEKRECENGK